MEKKQKLPASPYSKLEPEERLHIFVSQQDINFVRLLRPQTGTLTSVGSHLWQAFCTRCREMGIVDFTSTTQFEDLVQNLVVISKEEYESLRSSSATESLQRMHTTGEQVSEPSGASGSTSLRNVPDATGQDVGAGSTDVRGAHPKRKTKRGNV